MTPSLLTRGLLAAALLTGLGACADDSPSRVGATWDPLRGDPFTVDLGTATRGRDAWVGPWYGRESPDAESVQLLGDERAVLRVSTPSHLSVNLDAGEARRFHASLRRDLDGPDGRLRAEVFWEDGDAMPQSLAAVELDASTSWFDLDATLPTTAGRIKLVVRFAAPGQAETRGPSVSWASPRVVHNSPGPTDADLPDIILVTVDTLRADHISYDTTPWLAATLSRGQSWPQAVASSNWTLPAYGSLWTGLPADAHGAGRTAFPPEVGETRDFTALHAGLPTFVQTLRDAGYASCMVHQNPFLEPWAGLSRDFDRWIRVADAPLAGRDAADRWWDRNADRPRLLVLHFFAPHFPYAADAELATQLGLAVHAEGSPFPSDSESFLSGDHTPEERAQFFHLSESDRERARELYRAEVGVLDARLQEWLGKATERAWNRSLDSRPLLFAFHADHGEELWDAGSFEHGHSFDDSVIRVPLGLVWPGKILPSVDSRPVPARLLGMELLRVLGIEAPELPQEDLGPRLPEQAVTTMPLYRSNEGGRIYQLDGSYEAIEFLGQGSEGDSPELPDSVARQLIELGYTGD